MTPAEARDSIQTGFKRAVDRDVSLLVLDQLLVNGHHATPERCAALNDQLSREVWLGFSPDWREVSPNPGGTSGSAAAFTHQKAELVYALALGEVRPEQLRDLQGTLERLWLEWAGYMVTSEPDLIAALDGLL